MASSGHEPNIGLRLSLISALAIALLGVLGVRLWYLQILASGRYQQLAAVNTVRTVSIPAPRGLILDRTGKVLVGNRASWAVTVAEDEIPAGQRGSVFRSLGRLLRLPVPQITRQLITYTGSPYAAIPVATDVRPDVLYYLAEHPSAFPGVGTEVIPLREYPYGTTAAQILGYVGPVTAAEVGQPAYHGVQPGDIVGQAGVELSFDRFLRGRDGAERLEVNAVGQVVKVLSVTPPVPGDNLVLTIDVRLQQQLDADLTAQLHKLQAQGDPTTTGGAVVLDPQNGQVLAMSSYPTYNPKLWVGGITEANYRKLTSPASNYPLLDRAIQGFYTPGSTFKLATATAALRTGLITPQTLITDPGAFHLPGCTGFCTFHNSEGEALGPIDVTTALTVSDDVFFYNLGYDFWVARGRYGLQPIQQAARAYGLGERSGIALPGEAGGRVDSPSERLVLHKLYPAAYPYATWYAGDNVEMAFGQGETIITPLQLANAYATFGNGGTRYQPLIAAEATVQDGRVAWTAHPVVRDRVRLSVANHQAMLRGFIGAVQSGSGTAGGTFAGFPFDKLDVAGKTGTSSGPTKQPTALFACFAPATHPRYAMAVIVPQGGFGAAGAAPVAREIMQYLVAHPVGPVRPPAPATP